MPTAENALVQIEQGQTLVPWEALTDSGDQTVFTPSGTVLSGRAGYEPEIRPNGLATGGAISPTENADEVSVAALTCYLGGQLTQVGTGTVAIARPSVQDYKVVSITVTAAGALAAVEGTEGAAFSETRDAAGGPPLIPVDSIEIGQVRVSSTASAVIQAAEIYQVIGQHQERYDFPTWAVSALGRGLAAASAAEQHAHVRFAAALPAIHTGGAAKQVYAQYYTPIFGDESRALDFVPAETSHSTSSTQYYGGSIASRTSTLGQGSFTALLSDGVQDVLVRAKNQVLTVKFFPDRAKSAYILTQGALGVARSFPAGDQIQATVTITAEEASAEFAS